MYPAHTEFGWQACDGGIKDCLRYVPGKEQT